MAPSRTSLQVQMVDEFVIVLVIVIVIVFVIVLVVQLVRLFAYFSPDL